MEDIAIRVENISKQYTIGEPQPAYSTMRDTITNGIGRLFRRSDRGDREAGVLWAIKDISFEAKRGEVLGIIGRNGAGKSTLLKILCRITQPTRGYAEIYGRVGSLLEVGTGFHQELSGRENIYLSGTILGMRKAEIDRKFDEIVAFAEVERFIDTPVKHYSSGMYMRLAFSVAAHLEPEILLVDEVLAVGDAAFQAKCIGKMDDVAKQGRTVLFVSHNMAAVENLCHNVLLLQDGKVLFRGGVKQAIEGYLSMMNSGDLTVDSHVADLSNSDDRPSSCRPLLKRLELFTDDDIPVTHSFRMGASLSARIYFRLEHPSSSFDACLTFDNLLGQRLFVAHTRFQPNRPQGEWVGNQTFVCEIPSLPLVPGVYKIGVMLDSPQGVQVDRVSDAMRLTVIESDYYGSGVRPRWGVFVLKHRWYLEDKGDKAHDIAEKVAGS